jgi:hypothetical protein
VAPEVLAINGIADFTNAATKLALNKMTGSGVPYIVAVSLDYLSTLAVHINWNYTETPL